MERVSTHEARPSASVAQSFVKFFGSNGDRAPRIGTTLSAVQKAGNHKVCAYPTGKRPRQVQDGALMFMGRLVEGPNDVMIYGRAIAKHYEEGADDATEGDIRARFWRKKLPHYIRVYGAEFMGGTLAQGVSLNELMDAMGVEAFEATRRNWEAGRGNTDPRRSIGPQPAVLLTAQASAWVNAQLEERFRNHGKLSPADLADVR
ncbi:MAG: hypothetical protein ABSG84_09480 [Acidobacteriaceae bacterium]